MFCSGCAKKQSLARVSASTAELLARRRQWPLLSPNPRRRAVLTRVNAFSFGALSFLGGLLIIGVLSSDRNAQQNSSSIDTASEEHSAAAVVSRIRASQIVAEYEANEIAADARYKGKKFIFVGTVGKIGKDI